MSDGYQIQVLERAREISSAVFRVCGLIKHLRLRAEIEAAAISLVSECGEIPYLSYVPKGVKLPYLPYIEKLKNLIHLGEVVGEIKSVNKVVLERELNNLHSAIADSLARDLEMDITSMFERKIEASITRDAKEIKEKEPLLIEREIPPTNRKSAVLQIIRQMPNGCRMKDLAANFPEVSERTLRNDIQLLAAEGLVERIGLQGPSSFFRAVSIPSVAGNM